MSKPETPIKSNEKKNPAAEELKTEGPMSEKDEVKAAEKRTAKMYKKAVKITGTKNS